MCTFENKKFPTQADNTKTKKRKKKEAKYSHSLQCYFKKSFPGKHYFVCAIFCVCVLGCFLSNFWLINCQTAFHYIIVNNDFHRITIQRPSAVFFVNIMDHGWPSQKKKRTWNGNNDRSGLEIRKLYAWYVYELRAQASKFGTGIHYAVCQNKDRLYVFFFSFSRPLFFSHFARWMISRRETTNVKSIFHHALISFRRTPLAHTAHIKSRFKPYQYILTPIRTTNTNTHTYSAERMDSHAQQQSIVGFRFVYIIALQYA